MDRSGTRALLRLPGHGTVECEVDLKDTGAVPVALEGSTVTLRKVLPRDLQKLSRRNVEENGPGTRHLLDRTDPHAGVDLAAQRAQVRYQCVGYLLRAAL